MERVAEADPPEPSSGLEQRRADSQPPVVPELVEICLLHTALRQREQLAALFQAAREREISFRAVDAQRAAVGMQLSVDAAALRSSRAGRIPAAITRQGSAAVQSYLLSRQLSVARVGEAEGEDVLR